MASAAASHNAAGAAMRSALSEGPNAMAATPVIVALDESATAGVADSLGLRRRESQVADPAALTAGPPPG